MTIFSFEHGRKAVVTGGASGFGFAIAKRLNEIGAKIVLADINQEALDKAVAELGANASAVRVDVRDPDSVKNAISLAAETMGGIDCLVTSAGVFTFGEMTQIDNADWDLTLDVNLKGTFLVAQAALPYLRQSGHGRVVTISSTSGMRGDDLASHYSASKWGVIGLTQSMAVENGRYSVTCNVVCPGTVPGTTMGQSSMQQKIAMRNQSEEEIVSADGSTLPLGRLGKPEDIADAAMFLISDSASWITGQTLVVDGGALLAPPSRPVTIEG